MLQKQKLKEERKHFNEIEALTEVLISRNFITEDEANSVVRKQQPQILLESGNVETIPFNAVKTKEVAKNKVGVQIHT